MSLRLQSALNHSKTHFLNIKIQPSKERSFRLQSKVDFGLFSSVQKLNWYMDSRNDFALIVSVIYLLFKTKISFLVKFDSKA